MSSLKEVVTVRDHFSVTLYESDLTRKKYKQFWETEKRDIPRSDGLQWWLRYSTRDCETAKDNVNVFFIVNKLVRAKYNIAADGSSIVHKFPIFQFYLGESQYASQMQLRPLFCDGQVTVTCSIELDIEVPFIPQVPSVFHILHSVPTDVSLVVGSEAIQVHKNFISMISPVFNSMVSNVTAECKTGKIEITNFDFKTVKTVIDYCYGRELKTISLVMILSVLRFAEKYTIAAITNQFEKLPLTNLSVETFSTVVFYAYDCKKDALFAECCKFYKKHEKEIQINDKFAELPPALVVDLLKSAFDLKTNFDVLRHAYKNGITFVVEYLERLLLKQITIENFCHAVDYAWRCSRDDLKTRCAVFYNENFVQVMNLMDFHDLPSKTIGDITKLSFIIKQDTD